MAKTAGKPGAGTLGAAGLAPLALAMVAGTVTSHSSTPPVGPGDQNTPVKCEEGIENYQGCHPSFPTGCSDTGEYDAYLNFLKNQEPPRSSSPVQVFTKLADYADLERRTPKDLGKSNHFDEKDALAAMGEGQPHEVIGYLYYVKQEGAESSNCELTAPDDTDYHIGIGFDKVTVTGSKTSGSDKNAVVVEMTPQYRGQFAPEWTIEELKKILGKQVKVVGQFLADNEHNVTKDNCGLPGAGATCWRASIWELHPVTSFQYCNTDACDPNGPGWVDLGKEPEAAPVTK